MASKTGRWGIDYVPIVIILVMVALVAVFYYVPSPFSSVRERSPEGSGIIGVVLSITQGMIPASLIGLLSAFSAERRMLGIVLAVVAVLSLLASTAGLWYISPLSP